MFSLDFKEFVSCLSILNRGSMREKVSWVFRLYDVDGDGVVNITEMKQILKSAHAEEEDIQKIDELFRKMDVDKDGMVTREEFIGHSLRDNILLNLLGWGDDDQ